jgi:hypothetical protein
VVGLLRLAEFGANGEGIGEEGRIADSLLDARKDSLEMVLEKVLQETSANGRPQISLRVLTPAMDKVPHLVGVGLDEVTDSDDGLPPRIFTDIDGYPRQQRLGKPNGLGNSHGVAT